MRTDRLPRFGLAHLTALEVPPLDLVPLAARAGFALIGLRLHPAHPGGVAYDLPLGSAALAEMRRRLDGEGTGVHDIEFITIGPDFAAAAIVPVLEQAAALGAACISACGDDPDPARQAAGFAALCDAAAGFGLGVDLEWMGWRPVATLADALRTVRAAARPNGAILVDALHLTRNGAVPADLRGLDPALIRPALIRTVQICDAGATPPATREAIIAEARGGRLLPGTGALPLRDLLDALPDHAVLSCEIPMANPSPPDERAKQVFAAMARLFA